MSKGSSFRDFVENNKLKLAAGFGALMTAVVFVDQNYIESESPSVYKIGSIEPFERPSRADKYSLITTDRMDGSALPRSFSIKNDFLQGVKPGDCVKPVFTGVTSNIAIANFDKWNAANVEIVSCVSQDKREPSA